MIFNSLIMLNLLSFHVHIIKMVYIKNKENLNTFTIEEKLKLTYFIYFDTFTRLQLKK